MTYVPSGVVYDATEGSAVVLVLFSIMMQMIVHGNDSLIEFHGPFCLFLRDQEPQ